MKFTRSQRHVTLAFSIVVILLLIGAVFYHNYESLDWLDSFYVTIMTVITIGANGFAPTTDASKIFTMVYALVSVPTLIFCLGVIVEDRFEARMHKVEHGDVKK